MTLREEEEQTVPRRGRSCHGTVEGTEDTNDTDKLILIIILVASVEHLLCAMCPM